MQICGSVSVHLYRNAKKIDARQELQKAASLQNDPTKFSDHLLEAGKLYLEAGVHIQSAKCFIAARLYGKSGQLLTHNYLQEFKDSVMRRTHNTIIVLRL